MDFIKELKWRGMIHNIMPGTEEILNKERSAAYVGFDPTSDSLHIGHLVGVMMLKHFQKAGHQPIALLGGATGMIGDPSGKSEERSLMDDHTLSYNQECIGKQFAKFLDFKSDMPNKALLVNNYSWMNKFSFLDFIRDIGKHITINYMMAKDSVKKRIAAESDMGMSFTEFSYQLVQGFDFLHLYREYNCKLQMGGSDQWGNIVTGTELIRRKDGGEAYAITCPLITKADGTKFGKTEAGNVWLDPEKTSPYKFYQFWLNVSDDDAAKYLKIFTMINEPDAENLISKHSEAPHQRLLQRRLAKDITVMVHSKNNYEKALEASEILFGNATTDTLMQLDEATFLAVFEGVPTYKVAKVIIKNEVSIIDLCCEHSKVFASKGEMRRLVQGGGVSINKSKLEDIEMIVSSSHLINGKYILVQKGKKNYFIIKAE